MRKKKVCVFLAFVLSAITISIIFSLAAAVFVSAEAPDVGDSSCTTYAQARANGIQGTDAQLRSMGFCAGSGTDSTPTKTETPTDSSNSEKTQTINEFDQLYQGMNLEQLDAESEKRSNEFTICYDSSLKKEENCNNECNGKSSHNEIFSCKGTCYRVKEGETDECRRIFGENDYALNRAYKKLSELEETKRERAEELRISEQKKAEKLKLSEQEKSELKDTVNQLPTAKNNDDSALLADVVAGKHKKEVAELQNYYARAWETYPGMEPVDEEGAKKLLGTTKTKGIDVVNAKNNLQDAVKNRASEKEVNRLKEEFSQKSELLKKDLEKVLDIDSTNEDAWWQMATVAKWQGDIKGANEYYKNSLVFAKMKSPFVYKDLLDSINEPAMKRDVLQSMKPTEKIEKIPTSETSPILKNIKENLKSLVNSVDSKNREDSENIEKLSRAFSLINDEKISNKLALTKQNEQAS
ncbi:MAG: hypothetical protein Q8O89_07020 [Nanoarchaeota archaeon]|nr:hypothetical protein [Nanoarchaeota archaeon]